MCTEFMCYTTKANADSLRPAKQTNKQTKSRISFNDSLHLTIDAAILGKDLQCLDIGNCALIFSSS